ncbi:hypothetical protein [Winogradskyella endarachnes]|uniref:Uncharacterized protein n=1 Tax=Winogradskyella endarachnes TaxID=2681965 RepID=A0A6L6U881_9FLAO|nr:hypothetical protein [Winogradskyella endarachnes]MUU78378.1 hypothetical protein [Winogradskyella endarachnes]
MNKIKILILCLFTTLGYAQKTLNKTSQSIKVNKDVIVDLNTSNVEIQLETWNKNTVEIEAYIESETLSNEQLKEALEHWSLNVEGSNDKVTITSNGSRYIGLLDTDDYSVLLNDLEYQLIELPEMPEMPEMPILPEMVQMPNIPILPEMPEMPALPELPKGVTTIEFDYERYQEEGETYLAEWSKKYEKKGGKEFQKKMEDWARKFGESGYQEKMEKWGKDYAQRFEGKWTKEMEKWGEKFGEKYGEDMEKWGEAFSEKFGKEWAEKMKVWGERFNDKMEARAEALEHRAEALEYRKEALESQREARQHALEARKESLKNRRNSRVIYGLDNGNDSKVKKVIKIKIPKKAKLKTNIRHGELKLSSVIYNMSGDIAHSLLKAEHIDGGDTSINVAYSPIFVDTWNLGTLNVNFVDKAQIKNAHNLVLNSKSSNINIENLTDTGIVDGSFGELTIANLTSTFKNLNLVLEHCDALIALPKGLYYTLYFNGNLSMFNNKSIKQKTIRNYPEGQSTNRTIMINAKYSDVVID